MPGRGLKRGLDRLALVMAVLAGLAGVIGSLIHVIDIGRGWPPIGPFLLLFIAIPLGAFVVGLAFFFVLGRLICWALAGFGPSPSDEER